MIAEPADQEPLDRPANAMGFPVRLAAARLAMALIASAPALIGSRVAIASGPARSPYYTELARPLPVVPLGRFVGEIPVVFPLAILAAVVAIVLDQVLLAGAIEWLAGAPSPSGGARRRLRDAMRRGAARLRPFLFAAAWGLAGTGLGVLGIRALGTMLAAAGDRRGWSAVTMRVAVPWTMGGALVLWAALCGAWVFWTRVLLALDRRVHVPATGLLAARVLLRRPSRTALVFIAVALASMAPTGAYLASWFVAEPGSARGVVLWAAGWLAVLTAQACAWVWLVRHALRTAGDPGLLRLRERPDRAMRWPRWLRWRRPKAPRPMPESEPWVPPTQPVTESEPSTAGPTSLG